MKSSKVGWVTKSENIISLEINTISKWIKVSIFMIHIYINIGPW